MKQIFFYHNKVNFILALTAVTVESGMYVGIAFFIKALMEVAAARDLQQLMRVLGLIGVMLPGYLLIALLKRRSKNRFLARAARQYKEQYFGRVLQRGISAFRQESSAGPMSSLTNDFASIEQNLLEGYFSIWNCMTQLVFGLVSMIWLNGVLTAVILVVCLLPVLVSLLCAPKQRRLEKEVSEGNERFIAFVKDILTGFSVIKNFQAEKQIYNLFVRSNVQLETLKWERRNVRDMVGILAEIASLLVNVVIFTAGALLAIWGYLSASSLIAFFQLLNNVIGPLQNLSPLLVNKQAAEVLLQKTEQSLSRGNLLTAGNSLASFHDRIELENVSYTYEGGSSPVLKGIDFTFEKGKSYAIVGASGSGKSTLLNLLQQYSMGYNGQIRIDGRELREIQPESLYQLISVIQQNVFIFDDTIEHNITLYQQFPEEVVAQAVEKSGLRRLISEKGADYLCGENGCNLSGGEKQRISIARSLLRESPILLMDEATAALDAETSRMVEDSILSVNGLTRIIITHKLIPELLRRYDCILVMDRGRIAESGAYQSLFDKRGIFYSLCCLSGMQERENQTC